MGMVIVFFIYVQISLQGLPFGWKNYLVFKPLDEIRKANLQVYGGLTIKPTITKLQVNKLKKDKSIWMSWLYRRAPVHYWLIIGVGTRDLSTSLRSVGLILLLFCWVCSSKSGNTFPKKKQLAIKPPRSIFSTKVIHIISSVLEYPKNYHYW